MTDCAVCLSINTEPLTKKNGYRFSRCNSCDFIFLDPMPTQEELNTQYIRSAGEEIPAYGKAGSRMRRALMKLPRFFPYARRQDTLDLGCGGGFVTQALSLIAGSSTGIDINDNAIAYARSRFRRPRFFCRNFADLLDSDRQYGFIYSSEVMEHVSDINLFMRVLMKLAAPGAHVYITTPDAGHPEVPPDIRDWDVFCPPVHVQFFCKKTVTALFERYGFRIIKFYKNKKPGLIFLARKN